MFCTTESRYQSTGRHALNSSYLLVATRIPAQKPAKDDLAPTPWRKYDVTVPFQPATLTLALACSSFSLPCALAQSTVSNADQTTAYTKAQLLRGLDPDMASVILLYDAIKGTPDLNLTSQDARQQFAPQDAAKIIARGIAGVEAPTPVGKVIDGMTIPGRSGNQISIRI